MKTVKELLVEMKEAQEAFKLDAKAVANDPELERQRYKDHAKALLTQYLANLNPTKET